MNIVKVDQAYRIADGDTLIGPGYSTRSEAESDLASIELTEWDEMTGDQKRLFLMSHDSGEVSRKLRGSKNPFRFSDPRPGGR